MVIQLLFCICIHHDYMKYQGIRKGSGLFSSVHLQKLCLLLSPFVPDLFSKTHQVSDLKLPSVIQNRRA